MATVDFGRFQTTHGEFQELLSTIPELAKSNLPILIMGEPGSGRRLMAQEIHEKSFHRQKPLNRFIGEQNATPDRSENTFSGTYLIEDLQYLSSHEQEILFQQIRQSKGKIRWLATTSTNFFELAKIGLIRREFVQIFSKVICVPSLLERPRDIILLAEQILLTLSWVTGRVLRLSGEAAMILKNYSWPENIREMEEVLEASSLRAAGPVIEAQDLVLQKNPIAIKSAQAIQQVTTLAEMERKLIFQTLQVTQNNKSQAARLLGISIRTLRNKLSLYREEEFHEPNVR